MPKRTIRQHKCPGLNDAIEVSAVGEPGVGTASYKYRVQVTTDSNGEFSITIPFQEMPIKEYGPEGLTDEVLLAIVLDRFSAYQQSSLACDAFKNASRFINQALDELKLRRIERRQKGKE